MELKLSSSNERNFAFVFYTVLFFSAKCDDVPRNVVVMAGTDKVLDCSQDGPFRWYRYLPSDPNNDKVLFMGSQMADDIDERFRVLKEPPNYPFQRLDLLITDIRANHSGTYKCKLPQSALCSEVIVLDSEPKCKIHRMSRDKHEREEMMVLECSINVTDNGEPEMIFKHNTANTTAQKQCTARYNGMITCVAEVPARMQAEYTCSITIKHKPVRRYTTCIHASNEPDFKYTWLSSTEAVQEGVTRLLRFSDSIERPMGSLFVLIGFPTLGVIIIVLVVIVMFLACRGRKKKEQRYQKKKSSPRPNETPPSVYAALNISPYEEIPEDPERLYCTANPAIISEPYTATTRA